MYQDNRELWNFRTFLSQFWGLNLPGLFTSPNAPMCKNVKGRGKSFNQYGLLGMNRSSRSMTLGLSSTTGNLDFKKERSKGNGKGMLKRQIRSQINEVELLVPTFQT